ncbi:MAG: alpha/beta fold hydrolase [Myxococcaceae bacterium]|nr:alpha/beta fold hydrolase [Myxococcaceae bacterium]
MRPFLCVACLTVACAPVPVDPNVIETDAGVAIRRDVLRVPAPKPPPNPVTQDTTPDALDAVTVVRYRVDTAGQPPRPARAIVVLMPGFLGGAGSFDSLARAIVRRSTPSEPLEAWAIDRRSNLMEDRRGIEAALAAKDPELLTGYYFDRKAIDGQTFSGFRTQESLAFESEWGLASTMNDLRAVVSLVPEADRRARVILAGHSLGAGLAGMYAAWDFDGTPGFSQLAGLVLIDGVTGSEGSALTVTREEYETTGLMGGTFGGRPSLKQVRESVRYFAFPLLEAKLFPIGVGTAMRAMWRPDAIDLDRPRREALETLFLTNTLPRMTNRAAFGLAFDAATCPVSIAAVNAGATDGPLVDTPSPFGGGTIQKPANSNQTFRWSEFDQVEPAELTSLSEFALAWARTGVDFGEWYFPARLSLDTSLAASLTLKADDWPVTAYGVRALHGRAMDLPVLVEAAGILSGQTSRYDALKALLPTVGEGRPQAGASRTEPRGFVALSHPTFTHIDPLAGADVPGGAMAQWFDALAAFAREHTPSGGVRVP